jgi:hypothetical protein
MKKTFLFFAFSVCILLVNSETVTFEPTSDMYTDVEHTSASPVNTELWTADYTPAGHFERIMFDFPIDEILAGNIESADLSLTRFFSCPSSGSTIAKLYPITEEWDESTWNPHQHISFNQAIYQQIGFTGSGGSSVQEFTIDIMDLINLIQASQIEFHGFLLKAQSGQKFSKFYSKEHSVENQRPKLTINYSPVPNANEEVAINDLNINIYPNPFNPTTTISFLNKNNKPAKVSIYDLRGRLIKTFKSIPTINGTSTVTWNGSNSNNDMVSSGLYFSKITVGNESITKKIILQK